MRAGYDSGAAVAYAKKWALSRNPAFGDFTSLGGDCANFASQCLWAGWGGMESGWRYRSMNDRTPSWSGVRFLREWLMQSGRSERCGEDEAEPGDVVFLWDGRRFYHALMIVETDGGLLVAAHTQDALNRPLSSYRAAKARETVHIF